MCEHLIKGLLTKLENYKMYSLLNDGITKCGGQEELFKQFELDMAPRRSRSSPQVFLSFNYIVDRINLGFDGRHSGFV